MSGIVIDGVTHWSIPVNNLDESEAFYSNILGLRAAGRLGNSGMSRFLVGDHSLLICQTKEPVDHAAGGEALHHSFTVSPEVLVLACKLFAEKKVPVEELVYRGKGHFTGRELYFLDPSGNRLELRDPTWEIGMPEPTFEEIVGS